MQCCVQDQPALSSIQTASVHLTTVASCSSNQTFTAHVTSILSMKLHFFCDAPHSKRWLPAPCPQAPCCTRRGGRLPPSSPAQQAQRLRYAAQAPACCMPGLVHLQADAASLCCKRAGWRAFAAAAKAQQQVAEQKGTHQHFAVQVGGRILQDLAAVLLRLLHSAAQLTNADAQLKQLGPRLGTAAKGRRSAVVPLLLHVTSHSIAVCLARALTGLAEPLACSPRC